MAKPLHVWARVSENERQIVEKIADAMNMTISEFIRYLIIKELEKRSIIATKIDLIKEDIRNGADHD